MSDTPTEKTPFLLRPRSKGAATTKAKAEWLVMAYLAADNDLEGELLADLAEMERVGSHPGVVEILAQVDRSPGHDASKGNWHGTRRYYVTRGGNSRRINSRLLADLGPTNTGDPGVLESYMRFGAQRYPAKATALVLMNHGSGFYVPPEMLARGDEKVERAGASPAQRRRRRRPLFHTTHERLRERPTSNRGIAYDNGAGDCLDNQELKRVLATAHRLLGRKVDVVGMDACLMTMIEMAYQLRDHAKVLVGSEELEPAPGWPHAVILGDLAGSPAMTASALGATVVRRYVESYRHGGEEATQSAIDLGRLGDLVEIVDLLARRRAAGRRSRRVAPDAQVLRRPLRRSPPSSWQSGEGSWTGTGGRCVRRDPTGDGGSGDPWPDNSGGPRGLADDACPGPVDLLPGVPRPIHPLPGARLRQADRLGRFSGGLSAHRPDG
jgi:hypothetical protein